MGYCGCESDAVGLRLRSFSVLGESWWELHKRSGSAFTGKFTQLQPKEILITRIRTICSISNTTPSQESGNCIKHGNCQSVYTVNKIDDIFMLKPNDYMGLLQSILQHPWRSL